MARRRKRARPKRSTRKPHTNRKKLVYVKPRKTKNRRQKPRQYARSTARKRAAKNRATARKLRHSTKRPVKRILKTPRRSKRTTKRRDKSRQVADLQERVRKQEQVIRDLTRSPKRFDVEPGTAASGPADLPRGAKVLEYDDDGEPISFELPDMQTSWDEAEFFDFDWGDIDAEFGDEEQDLYGEDAG